MPRLSDAIHRAGREPPCKFATVPRTAPISCSTLAVVQRCQRVLEPLRVVFRALETLRPVLDVVEPVRPQRAAALAAPDPHSALAADLRVQTTLPVPHSAEAAVQRALEPLRPVLGLLDLLARTRARRARPRDVRRARRPSRRSPALVGARDPPGDPVPSPGPSWSDLAYRRERVLAALGDFAKRRRRNL
jgi:hypothetical protein